MVPHTLTNSKKIQNLTVTLKNHGNHLLGQEGAILLPRGDTINAAACCETLKELCWAIQKQAERNADARSVLTAR
jgi:hypothetical protein